ncbi:MAG: putative membrane protein [Salibacteraceae bacterium]|jgi:uncharacterized membrane protein
MKKNISIFLGVFMILGAIGHMASPELYTELIPNFIPELAAHILAIISETAIGIALIIPRFRKYGGLGFMFLMLAFLPIHIWDMLKEEPFIGTKTVASLRIAIQLVLIYAGGWLFRK